jgi:DNA-binding MarR family transcriptional regulator
MSTTETRTLLPGQPREFLESPAYLLKRLGMKAKRRTMDALEPTGLSPHHHDVLALLEEEPSETQAMIAGALGFDRSHLVGLLDELEEAKLIERRRDPDDRRRHVVSLTPAGKTKLAELRAIVTAFEDEFLAPLDAEQRAMLATLLRALARRNNPACGKPVDRRSNKRGERRSSRRSRSARPQIRGRSGSSSSSSRRGAPASSTAPSFPVDGGRIAVAAGVNQSLAKESA